MKKIDRTGLVCRIVAIIVGAVVIASGILLAVGADRPSLARETRETMSRSGSIEVMKNIYDDGQSTVYIQAEDEIIYSIYSGKHDIAMAIADITAKKKSWENQFPGKRVITMSFATKDMTAYGTSVIVGALIHYEKQ